MGENKYLLHAYLIDLCKRITQLYTSPIPTDSPVLSDEALPQAELAEDVHHDFHGCVHSDREGAKIQDAVQFDSRRSVG